jgi:uncharacterized protein YbjT (DUF2867 family)
VKGLLAKGIATTAVTRDLEKAKKLFRDENQELLSFVRGDFTNLDWFIHAIKGHTRIFLLLPSLPNTVEVKTNVAKISFLFQVKQIVDLSATSFWITPTKCAISLDYQLSEQNILNESLGKGNVVFLRPGAFFTNAIRDYSQTIKSANSIFGVSSPTYRDGLTSIEDIADVAVTVLSDPIQKHGNIIYDIISEVLTFQEQAEVFSRVLGRTIHYVEMPVEKYYEKYIKFLPHSYLHALITQHLEDYPFKVTKFLAIITNKPIRIFEDWVQQNKQVFM